MSNANDIPVKCTRCRHECMESNWLGKPSRIGGCQVTERVCPKCGCKSFYDMRPQVAWCWASGLIEFGDALPANKADGGAIEIAKGPRAFLKTVVSVLARHGYDKGVLLVPGVPEAEDEQAAEDALWRWLEWCAKSNGKKGRYGVTFGSDA